MSATLPLAYPTERRLAGIGLILLAIAFYAGQDAVAKHLSATLSTVEILFFRSFGTFVVLVPLALRLPLRSLRPRQPAMLLLRCLCGIGGMTFFIMASREMPLADVTAINFSGPLLATVLAVVLLGERIDGRRLAALAVGFLGVLIIVRPGTSAFSVQAFWALAAAVCYAGITLSLRLLSRTDHPVAVTMLFSIFGTLAAGALLPWFWKIPTRSEFVLLVLQGASCGIGQLLMTHALRLAPASTISAFTYTILIYAAVIGYFWFGNVPEPVMLAGAGLLIASCLYIAQRDVLRSRENRESLSPTS